MAEVSKVGDSKDLQALATVDKFAVTPSSILFGFRVFWVVCRVQLPYCTVRHGTARVRPKTTSTSFAMSTEFDLVHDRGALH